MLSNYAEKLEGKVKQRYLEKISEVGVDPLLIPDRICSHVEGRRKFFCSWEWRSRPTVFQIFLIYIKLTTLTTFLSKLVQFICYHSVITNNKAMPKENSEFVTLAILKEMLAAQERAYKTTTQLLACAHRLNRSGGTGKVCAAAFKVSFSCNVCSAFLLSF